MLHRFKTFETFEPKKVKDREAEAKRKKIFPMINDPLVLNGPIVTNVHGKVSGLKAMPSFYAGNKIFIEVYHDLTLVLEIGVKLTDKLTIGQPLPKVDLFVSRVDSCKFSMKDVPILAEFIARAILQNILKDDNKAFNDFLYDSILPLANIIEQELKAHRGTIKN